MLSKQKHPPKHLQAVLWTCNVDKLDINKNKTYIIHQLLSYGNISQWRWLFNTYSADEIQSIFLTKPYKDYRAPRFNFVTNYLLDINSDSLNSNKYVKNIPRDTRRPE